MEDKEKLHTGELYLPMDESILKEFNDSSNKKPNKVLKVLETVFNVAVLIVFCALFTYLH